MKIRTLTIAISLMMSSAPLTVYATEGSCEAVSLSTNEDGYINGFSFPPLSDVVAGEVFTSQCVEVVTGNPEILFSPQGDMLVSVNDNQFSSSPFSLVSGTTLQLKARSPETAGAKTTYRIVGELPDTYPSSQKRVYVNQIVSTSDILTNTFDTVSNTTVSDSEDVSESCQIVDMSEKIEGQELEPLLEGVPGDTVTSDCVKFVNVPAGAFVEPYRSETIVINGSLQTVDTVEIHENMTVALNYSVSAVSGDSKNLRFELSYFDDNSVVQQVYFRWRVLTENHLTQNTCASLTAGSVVNIPYSVESEDSPFVESMCLSVAESGSLSFEESGISVSVNGEIQQTQPIDLKNGDEISLVQIEDKNSRTFAYSGTFEDTNGSATGLSWITVNSEDIKHQNGEDSSDTQPKAPANISLTPDATYFSQCRALDLYIRSNGKRSQTGTMLSSTLEIEPGVATASECIEIAGMETNAVLSSVGDAWYSVNGAAFTQTETEVTNGDQIVLGYSTPKAHGLSQTQRIRVTPSALADNTDNFFIKWDVQTANTGRAPQEWHLSPDGEYKQIEDLASQLVAGDIINVKGGYEYAPFILEDISGTKANPIVIRGIEVDGQRPVFAGNHSRWPWTIGVRSSHSIRFENIEITGADTICFRHESHNIVLENVLLHGCKVHGILGTDSLSGSLTINQSEITDAGGKHEGRPWGHAIYVATDQYRFPDSKLKITHSFLHGNKGNTVKSRAERLELYFNWVEVNNLEQAKYALELIGPVVETRHPIQQDVSGNLFWLGKDFYAIRAGSDGTGGSNGIVRFTNNTVIHATDSDQYSFLRLDHKMTAVGLQNNVFVKKNQDATYTLIRDNVKKERWAAGEEAIFVNNNVLPTDAIINSTNSEKRKTLIKEYLSSSAYFDNAETDVVEAVQIDYEDKSLIVDDQNSLLQLGSSGSAFNGELQFNSPLKYMNVSYKAPNARPVEKSSLIKVTKDCEANTGSF